MRFFTLVVAMVVAGVALVAAPAPSQGADGETGIQVIVTAYTCDNDPRNPMHPCGPLRWGGDIYAENMACPRSWRGRVMEVPGFGTRTCDDTPRDGYLQGLPHVDLRVSSYEQARRIGVRRMTIYPVTARQEVETTEEVELTSADLVVAAAHELAPSGDHETAMARLLTVRTATKYFPWLDALLEGSASQPIWIVTLWVPESTIPAGSQAVDSDQPIASRLFIYDAVEGDLLVDNYVDRTVIEKMGWISSQKLDLQP